MAFPFSGLWPFGRKAVQQTTPKPYTFGSRLDPFIEHAIYGSVTVTASRALEFYRSASVVATAIDTIVKKVEDIRPVVRQGDDLTADDPVLELLSKPNNHTLYRQFIGTVARHYLLTGDLFFLGNGVQDLLEIYSGHPIEINPTSNNGNGYPDRYDVSGLLANGAYVGEPIPGQNRIRFMREDGIWQLYHLKGFSTRVNALRGDSPLESIVSEVRQSLAGHAHNESTLTKGARLSMLFAVKGSMPEETFNELEQAIVDKYSGPKGGSIGVVNTDEIEVTEFGTNNKDMDYVNLLQAIKSGVYSRYGIPIPLLVASSQTHSNFAEAIETLYDDAVIPTVEVIFEALTDFIFPRLGRDPKQEQITYDPLAIGALRRRRLREAKEQSEMNMLTTNEKRALAPDLDDIDGGDTVLAPSTLAPVAGEGVDLVAQQEEDRAAAAEAEQFAREQAAAQPQGGGQND